MARAPTQPPVVPVKHDAVSLSRAIERLQETLLEMENFDLNSVNYDDDGALRALNAKISRNIERAFGQNTSDANRFAAAASNQMFHSISVGGGRTSDHTLRQNLAGDLKSHAPLLKEAIRSLEEDLADLPKSDTSPAQVAKPPTPSTNKVFIVHGHDETAKEQVARFLQQLGIQPIILHEQANGGLTIIEKIERYSDVDYAIVLLTPDDIGAKKDEVPVPRARQNVVLELGYFIGKLGRSHVTAFRKGEVEIPSDYLGVVWEPFDSGWKTALGRELQAGGFKIDWNLIMGGGG